jgi:hypothetical protein
VLSSVSEGGLIAGSPEADTRDLIATYFHNNAWVAKGLEQWADLCITTKSNPSILIEEIRIAAQKLKENTLSAIRKTWPIDVSDWWLPGRTGEIPRPLSLTDSIEASHTNYRY